MRLADFCSQREPEAVDIADDLVAAFQLFEAFEEIRALLRYRLRVIFLFHHFHGFERNGRAERVRVEGGVRRARRENARIDELFPGPDAGKRVEAVRQGFAEDEHVRLDAEMLDRPELAGTEETHL